MTSITTSRKTVGGVGLFIRNTYTVHKLPQYQMLRTSSSVVENKWVEVTKQSQKYIIGRIYRHPNQNVVEFTSLLEPVLNSISCQKLPCIIAGDINIDLTKSGVNENTSRYVDSLLTNNFAHSINAYADNPFFGNTNRSHVLL